MDKFKHSLTLPCTNGADALKKLRKLMKRGCFDDRYNTDFNNLRAWNRGRAMYYSDSPCYLVVHKGGQVLILGHEGVGNIIKRVRDVENYRV